MATKNYIKDHELSYEIIICKGKGKLTRKDENMLVLIAENLITKKKHLYKKTMDDEFDCKQQSILRLLENWYGFNEKRYSYALPYFTEICKRGLADGYNLITNKKPYSEDIQTLSLDSDSFYNL
jgi:hypothetical protein